jgi:hypothetical protein
MVARCADLATLDQSDFIPDSPAVVKTLLFSQMPVDAVSVVEPRQCAITPPLLGRGSRPGEESIANLDF